MSSDAAQLIKLQGVASDATEEAERLSNRLNNMMDQCDRILGVPALQSAVDDATEAHAAAVAAVRELTENPNDIEAVKQHAAFAVGEAELKVGILHRAAFQGETFHIQRFALSSICSL